MEELYSPEQVRAIVEYLGIEIASTTETNLLCYCPYHSNRNTSSFSISQTSGLFMCFSAICDAKGSLRKLVQDLAKLDLYASLRLIARFESPPKPLAEQIQDLLKKEELPTFDLDVMNRMSDDLWGSPGQEYLNSRGLSDETLAYFQVGYSKNRNMIAIPMHDWKGNLVGVIGRSIKEKMYKNSQDLPTSKLLFNAHRAKKIGEKVIVIESAIDVLKMHEAGFKNVVSTNGGFFTEHHKQILDRYFNEIVIMTDMDDPEDYRKPDCKKCKNTCLGHNPGRAVGEKIIKMLPHKNIKWAVYDYLTVFPDGAKDPGEMSLEDISQCVKNAISVAEYEYWKKESSLLSIV